MSENCWKCAQEKVGGTPCDLHEAAPSPVRSDALLADCIIACNILQAAPEINPSNYDHDDVRRLNAAACEAYQVLLAAIKTATTGPTGQRKDGEG
jgi:hypothetical protein